MIENWQEFQKAINRINTLSETALSSEQEDEFDNLINDVLDYDKKRNR
jgi:hypothetical protein